MASGCNIYTVGAVMEKVHIHATTGAATGHDEEMALDYNLDTYWSPDSNGAEALQFDFENAVTVDKFAIWITDPDTDYSYAGTGLTIDLSYSDDAAAWTSVTGAWNANIETYGASGVNLKIFPDISESAHRYWKFDIDGNSTVTAQISQFFFCTTRSLTLGDSWPEQDMDEFYNTSVVAVNGRVITDRKNRRSMKTIPRKWAYLDATNFGALQNAFLDSFGSACPVIFNEGSTYYVCNFADDRLSANQVDYQLYSPSVTFIELPYIEDGETY